MKTNTFVWWNIYNNFAKRACDFLLILLGPCNFLYQLFDCFFMLITVTQKNLDPEKKRDPEEYIKLKMFLAFLNIGAKLYLHTHSTVVLAMMCPLKLNRKE